MEVTDKILEKSGDELFYAIINGDTLEKTIKTNRGNFTVKYPTEKDIQRINLAVARSRNGISAECFDPSANISLMATSTLNVLVISGPAWYENAKKNRTSFTWEDVPDTKLIDELYVKAWTFRNAVAERIGATESETNSGNSKSKNVQEAVDDGLFSSVSG